MTARHTIRTLVTLAAALAVVTAFAGPAAAVGLDDVDVTEPTDIVEDVTDGGDAQVPDGGGGNGSVSVESNQGGASGNGSVEASQDGVEADVTGEAGAQGQRGSIDCEVEVGTDPQPPEGAPCDVQPPGDGGQPEPPELPELPPEQPPEPPALPSSGLAASPLPA